MTPCREWQGALSAGYGVKTYDGPEAYQAGWVHMHRWVVAQVDGWDAIKDRVVMHLCDNPRCFRYDHLRIGTSADNTADMVSKGRHRNQRKVVCQNGHEFDRVLMIYGKPVRRCSICEKARRRARYSKLRR